MKSKNVIDSSNFPMRLPLFNTIVAYTVLEYWNAPQWLYGVLGTMYAIIWIGFFVSKFYEKRIDIFEHLSNDNGNLDVKRTSFKEKLERAMNLSDRSEDSKV